MGQTANGFTHQLRGGKTLSSQGHCEYYQAISQTAKKMFSKVEEPEVLYAHQPKIKVKLKADKQNGIIEIDELTLIKDVPKEAWEYKLGNRSAIEWVLDQYKEKNHQTQPLQKNLTHTNLRIIKIT